MSKIDISPLYYGPNPPQPTPFDRLYAITHFIMPNFGTMDWDWQTRPQVNENLAKLKDDTANLNADIMMYIHVPYCKSFCHYCNFNKNHYPRQSQDRLDLYVDYLIKEIDWYMAQPYVQARNFTAIYIGGGTPSTLSHEGMERLFTHLKKVVPNYDKIEKTFTGEPRSFKDIEKLKLVKDFAFDRVTFGIETFDPVLRKQIGRVDTPEDIDELFENLAKINYKGDRCVDLMYDLPGQTFDGFVEDLSRLVTQYKPEEADLFGTVYLPYRPMHKLIMKERLEQPGTMWQLLAMREFGYDFMTRHGYHNTIAETFSQHNRPSQYQTAHCGRQDIIGIGCAARGNVKDMVSINPDKIEDYITNIDEYGVSSTTMQPIGMSGVLDRLMVMFPRFKEIDKSLLEQFKDCDRYEPAMKILAAHIAAGCAVDEGDKYTINKMGVVWHGNLQTDYMSHTLNTQGKMLLKCISDKKKHFARDVRFGTNFVTKFILGNPELFPLLMK